MRCACGFGARIRLARRVARDALRDRGLRGLRRRRRSPFVGGPAGDDRDVVARLARQRALTGKPFAHPAGTGVVAGGGKTEIAEFLAQLAQIASGMAQRRDRIERIGKAAPIRRLRHELRDALGTLGAHGAGVEAALLPDDAGEELDRQLVFRRVLLDGAADVVGARRLRGCRRGGRLLRRRRRARGLLRVRRRSEERGGRGESARGERYGKARHAR